MERHVAYRAFWSDFITRVNQNAWLISLHGRINQSAVHENHYLDIHHAGRLFRYNIYWQKYDSPFVMVNSTHEEVPHEYGPLKSMSKDHWPEVQRRMVEAMLNLAAK